jgi:hypothetical protein
LLYGASGSGRRVGDWVERKVWRRRVAATWSMRCWRAWREAWPVWAWD